MYHSKKDMPPEMSSRLAQQPECKREVRKSDIGKRLLGRSTRVLGKEVMNNCEIHR